MRVQATISAFHRPAAAQNCKSPLFLRGSLRWGKKDRLNSKTLSTTQFAQVASLYPANEILTRVLTMLRRVSTIVRPRVTKRRSACTELLSIHQIELNR